MSAVLDCFDSLEQNQDFEHESEWLGLTATKNICFFMTAFWLAVNLHKMFFRKHLNLIKY